MAVQMKTEVIGIRDAVQTLKKLEPEIFKEFKTKAKVAVSPIVMDAQDRLTAASRNGTPLSGMRRAWRPGGRQIFPWNQAKAIKGVKVQVRPSKEAFLTVTQTDAAASIFDIAGRKNSSIFSQNLDRYAKASRSMWPAAEAKQDETTKNLAELVAFVSEKTERKLRY